MNILFQVAGFLIMIVIFIFYFYDRKAAVKTNKLFLYQGLAIFLSIFLDVFSIVMFNTPGLTYSFFAYASGKLYLVSCQVVAFFGLFYVLGDVGIKKKTYYIIKYSAITLLLVGSVLSLVLPLEIVYDPDGLNDYTGGLAVTVAYIATFFMMASTFSVALVNRKRMYKKRFIGVCIFLSIWSFGALIQAIVNYLFRDLGVVILSVSLAETLGSLVIYIMLENPALNIDRVTGALNQRAFEEYLEECMKKHIKTEFIVIDYDTNITSAIMGYNNFSKAVTDILHEYKPKRIFKNDRDDFVVVRNDLTKESVLEAIFSFKEKIYTRHNIKTEIPFKVLYFKDITLFHDNKDILDAINYLINNIANYKKELIDVNEELVEEIHNKFIMDKKCDLAFLNKSFEVYYQPIYSNNNSSFTAAEALVRLKDEDGNLIYPTSFIEEMEKDGRIVDLGKMVFEEVCKFISENDMEKLGLHYIEVNLSAVQCMQENLAANYITIMEEYKINPKYINLEITETAKSTRFNLIKNMEILKEYGVSFSLDDFGTGNSNLNYIVEMPVDIVKFDKNMVDSYFEDKIALYVMNSTINMIKGLGHKIVFEGIEEQDQLNQIKLMDVDYVQGYYYSKPINKEEFVRFIYKNNKVQ